MEKGILRKIILVFMVLLLAGFVWLFMVKRQADKRIADLLANKQFDKSIAELVELGYPVSGYDINQIHQKIMPANNGASLVLRAFADIDEEATKGLPIVGDAVISNIYELEPEILDKARKYIADNSKNYQLLAQGLALLCLYEVDYNRPAGEYMDDIYLREAHRQKLADNLHLKVVVDSYDSKIDQAFDGIEQMLALTNNLNQKTFIEWMHDTIICFEACDAIANFISICQLNDIQLQKLEKIVQHAQENFIGLKSILITKLALSLETYIEFDIIGQETFGKNYIDCMQQIIQASDLPAKMRRERFTAITDQFKGKPLAPIAFSRISKEYDISRTKLDYARAVVAVERYRLKHNKLPDSLEVLLGDYLEAVPLDMTTFKPAGYIAEPPRSYQIYDFGKDGIDNKAQDDDRAIRIR